jgi:hypothetical protein
MESRAHEYAAAKAAAYAKKFVRPVAARAVDQVYVAMYTKFMREQGAAV